MEREILLLFMLSYVFTTSNVEYVWIDPEHNTREVLEEMKWKE